MQKVVVLLLMLGMSTAMVETALAVKLMPVVLTRGADGDTDEVGWHRQ